MTEVLPSIRTTGQYIAPPSMQDDIKETLAIQEQREFGADCMDKKDMDEEKTEIAKHDQDVPETQILPVTQDAQQITQTQAQVQVQESDKDKYQAIINIMLTLKDDNKREREEHKREKEEDKINREREREENKLEFSKLARSVNDLHKKFDTVIRKDRIVPPADDGQRQVFVIMHTGEEDRNSEIKDNWRFPYCIINCQQCLKQGRETACVKKYPRASNIFEMPTPNARSMFSAFKKKIEEQGLPVTFHRFNFYIDDKIKFNIDNVKVLLSSIESDRVQI